MSISKEVPWPKIGTLTGEIPMKRRYAFRDMSYLDTLEARPIFETQADIVINSKTAWKWGAPRCMQVRIVPHLKETLNILDWNGAEYVIWN